MLGEINEKGCDYGGDMDSFFNSVKIETEKVIDTYYLPITGYPVSVTLPSERLVYLPQIKDVEGLKKAKIKLEVDNCVFCGTGINPVIVNWLEQSIRGGV